MFLKISVHMQPHHQQSLFYQDLQYHIQLFKTAKHEADKYCQRLSEVKTQLNLETEKLHTHMQECGNMRDLTMRQLALSLEEGCQLMVIIITFFKENIALSFCTLCITDWIKMNPTCPACQKAITRSLAVSFLLNNIVASLMGMDADSS
ncbi:hypothetical protein F5146DRAFT_1006717 [Armillaria mellea]|nr:hypothetical protein F5146DRAFT_1006717 [Armillaria mellea]